ARQRASRSALVATTHVIPSNDGARSLRFFAPRDASASLSGTSNHHVLGEREVEQQRVAVSVFGNEADVLRKTNDARWRRLPTAPETQQLVLSGPFYCSDADDLARANCERCVVECGGAAIVENGNVAELRNDFANHGFERRLLLRFVSI